MPLLRLKLAKSLVFSECEDKELVDTNWCFPSCSHFSVFKAKRQDIDVLTVALTKNEKVTNIKLVRGDSKFYRSWESGRLLIDKMQDLTVSSL